jgi:hypothetical protein
MAVAEMLTPSWDVTKELLLVHELVIDENGKPRIDRVDDESESCTFFIYFALRDEPFHLVAAVRPDEAGCLSLSWIYLQPGIRASLSISSEMLTSEEITTHVGLLPTETHAIGDPIVPDAPMRKHKENTWCFEPQANLPGSFDEKKSTLLNRLDPVARALSALKSECCISINVVFEGWGGDPQFGGFHLDADMIQRIAAYKAAIDLDLYASGPPFEDGGVAD